MVPVLSQVVIAAGHQQALYRWIKMVEPKWNSAFLKFYSIVEGNHKKVIRICCFFMKKKYLLFTILVLPSLGVLITFCKGAFQVSFVLVT